MPSARKFELNRRGFETLLFGGLERRRFTQDSPVRPDVWAACTQTPTGRLDLLLTPHEAAQPAQLALALRERLADPVKARLAYSRTNVAAELTIEEIIRDLLPLSVWWQTAVDCGDWPDQRDWLLILVGAVEVLREHGGLESVDDAERERRRFRRTPAPGEERPDDTDLPSIPLVSEKQLLELGTKALPEVVTSDAEPLLWQVARNREAELAVARSRRTVKADAAELLFDVKCGDLAWAVVDSGIDARHVAFRIREDDGRPARAVSRSRIVATYDFTRLRRAQEHIVSGAEPEDAGVRRLLRRHGQLIEELRRDLDNQRPLDWQLLEPLLQIPHDSRYIPPPDDHGTHVAGIIGADWPEEGMRGVCPTLRMYDLRVVDPDGVADEFAVNAALQFIDYLNGFGRRMIVHGANVSMSLRHAVDSFACGQTPVCREANHLASSGVVVVAAAGNYGRAQYELAGKRSEGYRSMGITDPGNAEGVITVGATHRDNPHTYGVSYFSSRGPTGDGRSKPDLVAPGEKITAPVPGDGWQRMDGTSQAAPHVSGVAALLLGRHREMIGNPERVKHVLRSSATDLGREPAFQGAGLLDALRALQEL